jgi:hypothetical protein
MPTHQFSRDNVFDTGLMAFFEGAGDLPLDYEQTFDWRFDTNVNAIKLAPYALDATPVEWDGKSDLPQRRPDALDPQLFEYVIFGIQVVLSPYEQEELPTLLQDSLRQVGQGCAEVLITAAAAAKANGFVVPSVHAGKTLFATDHPTRAGDVRGNRVNSGLDRSALNALESTLETWPSFEGYKRNRGLGGKFLEYNPTATNRQLIHQLYFSGVTSDQQQSNVLAQDVPTLIKNPYLPEDKVILGALAPGQRPYLGWMRKAWQISIVTGENNGQTKINIHGANGFRDKGVPDGAVGLSIT